MPCPICIGVQWQWRQIRQRLSIFAHAVVTSCCITSVAERAVFSKKPLKIAEVRRDVSNNAIADQISIVEKIIKTKSNRNIVSLYELPIEAVRLDYITIHCFYM